MPSIYPPPPPPVISPASQDFPASQAGHHLPLAVSSGFPAWRGRARLAASLLVWRNCGVAPLVRSVGEQRILISLILNRENQ